MFVAIDVNNWLAGYGHGVDSKPAARATGQRRQLDHSSTGLIEWMVQWAIPKLISMLAFFYIGRMLTSDVDLLPAHFGGKNQNKRDRGGRHELHEWARG